MNRLKDLINERDMKGKQLGDVIKEQLEQISNLSLQKKALDNKLGEEIKKNAVLAQTTAKALDEKQDAVIAKLSAEEVAKSFEDNAKQLRR